MPEEFVAAKPARWIPHVYQRNSIKFMIERAVAALFLDPGLGKTSITLGAMKILKKEKLINRVLVIAPLRVCYSVWPREVKKWEDFSDIRVQVLHGKGKEQALRTDADVYVINPEGLAWLMTDGRFKLLGADVLVIDESSKFKHTNTARFKTLKPVLGKFARRYILTGTPCPNGLLDLFGQVYILDMGKSFGPYITHYRTEFFEPTGFGGFTWVPKPDTETRIQKILKPLALRLSAKDYLDLPELLNVKVDLELPPDARRVYDQLETELITLVDGQVVTALSVAAANVKCRQVANGGLYKNYHADMDDTAEKWLHIHNLKTEAVVDTVEELNGQPALIAYEFGHDRERLLKAFGKDTPYIGGGVSPKRSSMIERAWNEGRIPVLLGHPASMGHGLNLQESGGHVLWHSLIYDLELRIQFIQRILRQGNTSKRVFCYDFVMKNTVDEIIVKALARKDLTQNALLESLKDYVRSKKSRK